MGIFDKLKEMKDNYDAKKAAEAAELLALCNRLRQNEIFLNYADKVYNTLSDPSAACIQWATGGSKKEIRKLALIVTPNDFGLVTYCGEEYRDSKGEKQYKHKMDIVDVQSFADYGMQALPNKREVMNAVLETLASRLKEISYLSLDRGAVEGHDAINIRVSYSNVQHSRTGW